MSDLQQVEDNVFEGTSTSKGEKRRFLQLPEGLSEEDTANFLEGFWNGKKLVGWDLTAHINQDVTSKNEIIDGRTYIRLLATADIAKVKEMEEAALRVLGEYRAERENIGPGLKL